MISYVTVGADDIAAAKRFYDVVLRALGYDVSQGTDGLSYVLPVPAGQTAILPDYYVKPTFNGAPATAGNGSMVAFEAADQQQVRDLHAAGVLAGCADDGQPGFRADYGSNFCVSYLRDPQSNKIAVFSSNPKDPSRDG